MINAQTHILRFLRCVAATARLPLRWRLLYPFAVVGLVELLLIGAYIEFTTPGLARLTVPAIAFFFGDEVVHYPQHIWRLPAVLDWVRFASTVLTGVVLYPVALRRLHAHFDTAGSAPRLVGEGGTATVFAAVALFSLVGVSLQRGVGLLADVPIVGRFQPVWLAGLLVVRPLLILVTAHTIYGITVGGRRGLAAVRSGLLVSRHHVAVTAMLAVTAALLLAPLDVALSQSTAWVDAGHPGVAEMVATLSVLWDIPVRLVLFASAVWLRVTRVAP